MLNALTVDVEDYFHANAMDDAIDPSQWDTLPQRVEANTYRLLDILSELETRATFFVLGWVADKVPQLVKRIAALGHEVACHGYSHELIYRQTPGVFAEETRRSKTLLEDLTGMPVIGYRAASFSITPRSRWALDTLIEQGFLYDSSIFPVRHDRYGMPGPIAPRVTCTRPRAAASRNFRCRPRRSDRCGCRFPVAGTSGCCRTGLRATGCAASTNVTACLSRSISIRGKSTSISPGSMWASFRDSATTRTCRNASRVCGASWRISTSQPCVTYCVRADYCHLDVPEASNGLTQGSGESGNGIDK